MKILSVDIHDLRFPTSEAPDGSDAMNPDPDYSAAYAVLRTDGVHEGHGLTFTIGRGNEVVCAAIRALSARVVGLELDSIRDDPDRFWRYLTGDSQLRWIGPDKGAIHLATAALVNAVWDLLAKEAGKPVWRLIADMSPQELLRIVNFRYITDALTPDEALALLERAQDGKAERVARLEAEGYPAYTTSAGWLGYPLDKVERLAGEAMSQGFTRFKMKVGTSILEDRERLARLRAVIGPDRQLLIDANQVWETAEAIRWVNALAEFDPYFIEEPTSPDDVEAHHAIREAVAPIKVATGEMCQNRIVFKQLITRGAIDIAQVDACRLGGLNEVFTVMLIAAKYGVPVWPHAGGVGLCEYVQHHSMIDYLVLSGSKEGRALEYVDHLHEHFVDPCRVRHANYVAPERPGFSVQMKPASIAAHRFAGEGR
jgi:L-fuconate dehydratase